MCVLPAWLSQRSAYDCCHADPVRPPRAAYEWPIVQCKCNHWGPCCCRSVRPATTESVRLPLARVSHAFRAGERGPTPLHPGGPPLGGPTSSASSTRRLQVCRIATPSPIPSPSSHPSLPFPPSMPLPCHRASPRPHPAPRHPLGMSLFLRPPSLSSLPSLPSLPSAIARLSRWWFGAR